MYLPEVGHRAALGLYVRLPLLASSTAGMVGAAGLCGGCSTGRLDAVLISDLLELTNPAECGGCLSSLYSSKVCRAANDAC